MNQAPYSPDTFPCDFGCFPNWRHIRFNIWRHERDQTNMTNHLLMILKGDSEKLFGSWRMAGISVWNQKEPTLKGIRDPAQKFCKFFPSHRLDTFWPDLLLACLVAKMHASMKQVGSFLTSEVPVQVNFSNVNCSPICYIFGNLAFCMPVHSPQKVNTHITSKYLGICAHLFWKV